MRCFNSTNIHTGTGTVYRNYRIVQLYNVFLNYLLCSTGTFWIRNCTGVFYDQGWIFLRCPTKCTSLLNTSKQTRVSSASPWLRGRYRYGTPSNKGLGNLKDKIDQCQKEGLCMKIPPVVHPKPVLGPCSNQLSSIFQTFFSYGKTCTDTGTAKVHFCC
jgi:hypothetical protein